MATFPKIGGWGLDDAPKSYGQRFISAFRQHSITNGGCYYAFSDEFKVFAHCSLSWKQKRQASKWYSFISPFSKGVSNILALGQLGLINFHSWVSAHGGVACSFIKRREESWYAKMALPSWFGVKARKWPTARAVDRPRVTGPLLWRIELIKMNRLMVVPTYKWQTLVQHGGRWMSKSSFF